MLFLSIRPTDLYGNNNISVGNKLNIDWLFFNICLHPYIIDFRKLENNSVVGELVLEEYCIF